jgi:predicted ArsR family transcriptional regulator
MKKSYTLTLEGNEDFLVVKSAKEKILDAVPKGQSTTAAIISEGLEIHVRRALAYLRDLEEDGFFESTFATIKFKSNAKSRCRVFKRL